MEPKVRVSAEDEAQFRVSTTQMYKDGGIENVLACILTMQQIQNIIFEKLNELIEEDKRD